MRSLVAPSRTSCVEVEHATSGQRKHVHYQHQQVSAGKNVAAAAGDRMRGKAASVSETPRHRLNHVSAGAVNKTTASGCSVAAVPDFRELASFQFHTRSGSFGSERANGSSSGGSGASSTDPCSSEDDLIGSLAAALYHEPSTGRAAVPDATAPAASAFNKEFPSLAPAAADVAGTKVSHSVWDSAAKFKVMGGSGMKKLWVKSNNADGKQGHNAAQPTNNKLLGVRKAVAATPAMEILVKNPKITSSRSDFFKSLRSSSSSNTTTTPSADTPDKEDSSLSDDVFRQKSLDVCEKGSDEKRVDGSKHKKLDEDEGVTMGRSADSVLSSSLEAEQRLLKEMGWKEEEDDLYEPLTEDEVREFRDLLVARETADSDMTCSKNLKNSFGHLGKITSSWTGASFVTKKKADSNLAKDVVGDTSSSSSEDSSDDDDGQGMTPSTGLQQR